MREERLDILPYISEEYQAFPHYNFAFPILALCILPFPSVFTSLSSLLPLLDLLAQHFDSISPPPGGQFYTTPCVLIRKLK